MTTKAIRTRLERLKGRKENILNTIENNLAKIDLLTDELHDHEEAREVIKQVGMKTQEQLSYNISEITSMAMEAVLNNPYEVVIDFVERRNKTECDILFKRGENIIDPFRGGGGAIDTAAFALRIASYTMQRPRTRPVLILDEPFKHLKGEGANVKMLEMVKEISEKIGIQIIMVSDERVSRTATLEHTDKLFEVFIKKGVSIVNVEK